MHKRGPWVAHVCALAAYVVIALVFSWPLPTHLDTHLTGRPDGDTGVYVWNQWVFREELVHGHQPYFTEKLFSLTPRRANLSLHNYTTFQNLLALPLIGVLGVVTTFNVVYLLTTILTAYGAYLLVKEVTGSPPEAWLAGMLFAWSPILVARGAGHFSLVAAAPLAVFLLLLRRAARRERLRDALALGACVWWAASTDVYYAVYCLAITAVFFAEQLIDIPSPLSRTDVARAVPRLLDGAIVAVAVLVLSILVTGGWQFTIVGQTVRMHTLYTPMLVLTALVAGRVAWRHRLHLAPVTAPDLARALRVGWVAVVVAIALLSPVLYALGERIAQVGVDRTPILWRSSSAGVDTLAFFLPNPNHPLAPQPTRDWLARTRNGYIESVVSLSFVAIGLLAFAWRKGWRPDRLWIWLTVAFGALSLGPFVHVAGVNTHIPGPWALLRYIPVLGLARMPARFSVVMMLAVTVMFGAALCWMGRRWPRQRLALLALVGGLVLFELWPVPRKLYSARIPKVYAEITAAPDNVRVLHLPFGVRDGNSSEGNFRPSWQFFQTAHGKPLIGGYLSRVSRQRKTEIRSEPVLGALMALSEGTSLTDKQQRRVIRRGAAFVERANLGFVVIDRTQASQALVDIAMRAFSLTQVATDGAFDMYRPLRASEAPTLPSPPMSSPQ